MFAVRSMRDADKAFVISSWRSSFRRSDGASPIPHHLYHDMMGQILEDILARPETDVRVAVNLEDDDQIFGWAASDADAKRPTLHYAYVKSDFRKHGICRRLLEELGIQTQRIFYYTFRTPTWAELTGEKGPFSQGHYRPQLVRSPSERKKEPCAA